MRIADAGQVKISARGAVNLPARVLRELGWQHGDDLFVEITGEDHLVLTRRPENIVDELAGRLTHLFPNHEDNLRFIDEERASWNELDRRLDP